MNAPPSAAMRAAREIRALLGLSGSHDSEVAAVISRHCPAQADAGEEFVSVPREPTEAMLHASWLQSGESYEMADRYYARMREHWRAMLAAADAGGWQPVSEAPPTEMGKGNWVLLWGARIGARTGELHNFRGYLAATIASLHGNAIEDWGVTHFMSLPSPPPAVRP